MQNRGTLVNIETYGLGLYGVLPFLFFCEPSMGGNQTNEQGEFVTKYK